jgi:tetratricopeptide (TPR) repeat protein
MQYWAKRSFLIITVLAASLAFGQFGDPSRGVPISSQTRIATALGMIAGSVHDTNNQPVKDARIEVRALRDGQTIASAYSNADGQFEIDQVPSGNYEIVVTSGLAQERQQLAIDGATANVNLRLASEPAADSKAGNSSTVSVAAMEVPKKARQHYQKAAEEVKKSKFDEAQKDLEAALAVYPHYAEALALRGILKMDHNQMPAALSDLQEAINSDPNYPMAYVAVGSCYNALAQYDNAVRALERAQELDPRSWQAHFEMAKAEIGRQH